MQGLSLLVLLVCAAAIRGQLGDDEWKPVLRPHPLVGNQPKAISSWVSNTDRASYYSLSVAGHTFYRLNYPLRLNRWYHSCQSWNGRTGEWQIWVDGERVGRGFHNRLVGHVIKGGGVAITGQEQNLPGNYPEPKQAAQNNGGMEGELTMLQLYHVALTAGKAHKDHKHHHVHHFGHDGTPLSNGNLPPPSPAAPPAATNSILTGGQINPSLELNLGNPPQLIQAQLSNGLQLNQNYINGQFGPGRFVSEQLLASQNPPDQLSFNPGNVQFIRPQQNSLGSGRLLVTASPFDSSYAQHNLYKRNKPADDVKEVKRNKREDSKSKMEKEIMGDKGDSKRQTKRGLIALSDGTIVNDGLASDESFEQSLLNGLAGLGENIPVQNLQKEQVDEREPAEAEVRAVMQLCSGCSQEPFQKALVLSWRGTPKKLFSGARFFPAIPVCKSF